MAIPKVRGLLNKIDELLKKTDRGPIPNAKGILKEINEAIEGGGFVCKTSEMMAAAALPPKTKKGKDKGKAKYYWQFCEQKDVPRPVFMITPKDYFDAHKALSDESYDGSGWLPEGFHELMESNFEFDGTRKEAEAILRANPLFEGKVMFPEGGLE